MKYLLGVVMGCILASAWAEDTSSAMGKVVFSGPAPADRPVRVAGDDFCERAYADSPLKREDVIVNPNSTLKNVVVWVEAGWPEGKKPDSKSTETATLRLKNCAIEPHVIALQSGQPLQIVSMDDTVHNINTRTRANNAFNETLPAATSAYVVTFEEPEIGIKLQSAIHPWMNAYVAVFDHPAFAVTGEDGRFVLPDLPIGEYRIAAWHEAYGTASAEVLVQRDVTTEVEFIFTATGAKSGTQINSLNTSRPIELREDDKTTAPGLN